MAAKSTEVAETVKKKKPLSQKESQSLVACEAKVKLLMTSFVEAGKALKKIVDGELYRATHDSFNGYCKAKWSFGQRRAQQLMAASTVVDELKEYDITPLPSNENQARLISQLADDEEERAALWETVIEKSPEDAAISDTLIREVFDATQADAPDDDGVLEDESLTEKIQHWNNDIDSWARAITAVLKEAPSGCWLDDTRIDIIKSELKSAAATARATKAFKSCPKCEGDGCTWCRKSGFVPKVEFNSMGES